MVLGMGVECLEMSSRWRGRGECMEGLPCTEQGEMMRQRGPEGDGRLQETDVYKSKRAELGEGGEGGG